MSLEKNVNRAIAKQERSYRAQQREANVRARWTSESKTEAYARDLRHRFEPVLFSDTILPLDSYEMTFKEVYAAAAEKDLAHLRKEFLNELGPGRWSGNFIARWNETKNAPNIMERMNAETDRDVNEGTSEGGAGCLAYVFWGAAGLYVGNRLGGLISPDIAGKASVAGLFIGILGMPHWSWLTGRALESALLPSQALKAAEHEFDSTIKPEFIKAQQTTLDTLCTEYRASRGELDRPSE